MSDMKRVVSEEEKKQVQELIKRIKEIGPLRNHRIVGITTYYPSFTTRKSDVYKKDV